MNSRTISCYPKSSRMYGISSYKLHIECTLAILSLRYRFGKFEARLTENEARGCKSGYFVGDTMTVADLKAFYGLNGMAAGNWDFLDVSPILAKMPKITAFLKMMNEDEGIKKFNAAFKAQMEKTKADAKDNVHIIKGKNVYVSL